jgi:peptide/nickel transport system substrate-binding protein
VFVRNENYWQSGRPYLDELVITNLADESAQLNALRGGQADVVNNLSVAAVAPLESSANVQITNGGVWNPFVMNTKAAPFTDPRVMQAFKLMVDREQMRTTVFGEDGTIANDLYSPEDPVYNADLPQREHDPERAKALLKEAGQEGLSIELVASELGPGMLKEAQILAQQAKAVGVDIKLRQVTPGEIFGPNYQKWPFTQDVWFYVSYFPNVALASLPGGAFNATQFDDAPFAKLYGEAIATLDEGRRTEIAHEMQAIQYDRNGYIIPFFSPSIDGMAKAVNGVKQSKTGTALGNFDFTEVWLT